MAKLISKDIHEYNCAMYSSMAQESAEMARDFLEIGDLENAIFWQEMAAGDYANAMYHREIVIHRNKQD